MSFIAITHQKMTTNGLNFGDHQSLFEEHVNKGNVGFIDTFVMMHERNDEGLFSNQLTYIPNQKQISKNEQFVFTITFDDIPAALGKGRSRIRISVDQGLKNLSKSELFCTMDYDYWAGSWLISSFFGPNRYKYNLVHLMLPPRYHYLYTENDYGEIKHLKLDIRFNMNDREHVKWWLEKFDERMPIHCISITTCNFFEIKECQRLKSIPRVEISGPCDIDNAFLKDFQGKCFYWRNMKEGNKLSDTDLIRTCNDCIEQKRWKAIFLDQGSPVTRALIVNDLILDHANATDNGTDFYVRHENGEFRFRMIEDETVFGNFEKKEHMDRKFAMAWSKD